MTTTLQTQKNLPTHQMVHIDDEDYIAVVGARTRTWDVSLGGVKRGFLSDKGNQYMFINQGLLQLQLFPLPLPNYKRQRILVVFQHGYTATDIQRINKYTEDLDARIVYVKTVEELTEFLNSRIQKKRMVKQLVFFSHGIVGKISLRYEGDEESSGEFSSATVEKIIKDIFHYDTQLISYACRTGIGVNGESFKNSAEAQPENSLAQYMANKWLIDIKAFERRSLYSKTYGTSTEIKEANDFNKIIKAYENQEKLFNGGNLKEKPQKPLNYDKLKKRLRSIEIRDQNAKNDNGPIMPLGAWHLPTSGATPSGLKNGLQVYRFKKK